LDDVFIFISEKNYPKAKEILLQHGKSAERIENNLIKISKEIYQNVDRTDYGNLHNARIQE